eukprot:176122_1
MSRFDRRPSFWKTPHPRNPTQIVGNKRNFTQLNEDNDDNNNNNKNELNHISKKRRLLNQNEIENIAQSGGFNASNIIIAVEESDGFKWFKRIRQTSNIQNEDDKKNYLKKYWNIDIHQTLNNVDTKKNDENPQDGILRELTKEELKEKMKLKQNENENERKNEEKKKTSKKNINQQNEIHKANGGGYDLTSLRAQN